MMQMPSKRSVAGSTNTEKRRIVQYLRSDLYRLAEATTYDDKGDVDNTYTSPGGLRVRVYGPADAPHVIAWDSKGALLFDRDPASVYDLEADLP